MIKVFYVMSSVCGKQREELNTVTNERPEKPKLQNMGFCIEHQTFYFYNSENRREKGVVEGVRQR